MQPYVLKQGDYLANLAHRFGFDADAVWNDPANAELRQLRPNPNILWPSDILYIPDQVSKKAETYPLAAGQMNAFVTSPPTVTVTVRFTASSFASQGFTVPEQEQLTGLTTTGDGTATFDIPVTLSEFTIVFTESGTTFSFGVGHLDPIDTLSGVAQRLQNLGYLSPKTEISTDNVDAIRVGLRAFKASQGANDQPAPASGSPPPPPSSPSSSGAGLDDAGLGDDGKLDDSTTAVLLAAHVS